MSNDDKPMARSDTPRTDAVVLVLNPTRYQHQQCDVDKVLELARQLERELATCRRLLGDGMKRIRELEAAPSATRPTLEEAHAACRSVRDAAMEPDDYATAYKQGATDCMNAVWNLIVARNVAPSSTEPCKHAKTKPDYEFTTCLDCGSICTDGEWGIASRRWFKSVDEAKFYRKNGRLPDAAPSSIAASVVKPLNPAALQQHSLESGGWLPISSAPKDGSHFLACCAKPEYDKHWTFNQRPPTVVHWWNNPGEEGFYVSVSEQEPQHPFDATHWKPLGPTPPSATEGRK